MDKATFSILVVSVVLMIPTTLCGYVEPALCQDLCLCVETEVTVDCNANDRLPALPTNVRTVFTRLNIQRAQFRSPYLSRSNLTGLEHLISLKIIYTGLTRIDPYTFIDMGRLDSLDLSVNKLQKLQSYVFSGLRLTSLNLQDNAGLQLEEGVFHQMIAKEIDLRNNAIHSLSYATFAEAGVEKLFLFNNSIKVVDPNFRSLFAPSSGSLVNNGGSRCTGKIFDLTRNPLQCHCELKWLAEALRQTSQCPYTKDVLVTCDSPDSIRGRALHQLTDENLGCPRLSISEIRLDLTQTSMNLGCIAEGGGPLTEMAWSLVDPPLSTLLPTSTVPVITSPVVPTKRLERRSVLLNVTLEPLQNSQPHGFRCSAWNSRVPSHNLDSEPEERAEVVVRILAPPASPQHLQLPSTPTGVTPLPSSTSWRDHFLFQKHFDLLELLTAVCVTFLVTMVLMLLLSRYLLWSGHHRMWLRHRCVADKTILGPTTTSSSPCSATSVVMTAPPPPCPTMSMPLMASGPYCWSPGSPNATAYSATGSQHEYDVPRFSEAALAAYHPLPMHYPPPPGQVAAEEFFDFKTQRKLNMNSLVHSSS